MSALQRAIKYCAIAFALILALNIIFGILVGTARLSYFFDRTSRVEEIGGYTELPVEEDTSHVEIKLTAAELIIKSSDTFRVESNSGYIDCRQNGKKLTVTEKKHSFLETKPDNQIIVYVTEEFVFDDVDIETGAGKISIDRLNSKTLSLELGAGSFEAQMVNVSSKASIEGGVGQSKINGGSIKNLEMNMGVGELTLTSKLFGRNEIDCGVGRVNLNLIGSADDYTINMDKGVGSAVLDGKKMDDDETYGNGEEYIEISGGMGSIDVEYV